MPATSARVHHAPAAIEPVVLTLCPLGGPTVLIDIDGLRLLVDPTFDPPGSYPSGSRSLHKTAPGAMTADELGPVDLVLLSHDQHADNLDTAGREVVARTPTLTTAAAAERLGGTAVALPTWAGTTVVTPTGRAISVTAVPAQHGPPGSEHLMGQVTGFVLTGDGVPTIHVSGDNASLEVVRRISDRFPRMDLVVLFAGAARTPSVDGPLTLTSADAARAARIFGAPRVLPVHTDGWAHFTEDHRVLRREFRRAGLSHLLLSGRPGCSVTLR